MPSDAVHQLLASGVALGKLGGRGISAEDARALRRNGHVIVRNPRARGPGRRLLIGRTDGGQILTLVIERTVDPTHVADRHWLELDPGRA